MRGRVKWWSDEKRFGFLVSDSGIDHFVHHLVLVGVESLTEGQVVEFTPEQTERGPRAHDVRVVSEAPPGRRWSRAASRHRPNSGAFRETFDVFISHGSEDKDAVARPLYHQLRRLGYAVWFDEARLRIGDSLRESIERGLAVSRFGVVILSRAFFRKPWPQRELDGSVSSTASWRARTRRAGRRFFPYGTVSNTTR
jgi:cold shock CspA family protein